MNAVKMCSAVATFEWRYQLKSPVFWVGFMLFFLLTFGSITVDQIQIGGIGAVNLNSPFAIVQTLTVMGVFGIFVVVAMVAGSVIRDEQTGFAPISGSCPVTRLRAWIRARCRVARPFMASSSPCKICHAV